jgi:formylglycine-generating enzyme required for sulfatase activity
MNKKNFLSALYVLSAAALSAQSTDTSFRTYQQAIPSSNLQSKMVAIPAGTFKMGSADADKQKEADETPQREVKVSAFWMGAYEVTYDEFNAFFLDESISQNTAVDAVTRPSSPYIDMTLGMGKAGGFPANSMQQYGALMYCKWLYKKTGIFFRLPTEAEWEYACRAGATTTYPFGNDAKELGNYAWFNTNSENRYHKVGEKKPNAWGLHDMLGNVGEWVLDQYSETYFTTIGDKANNPLIEPTNRYPRTVKGGTYQDEAKDLRSANRIKSDPVWNRRDPQIPRSKWWNADAPFIGFRIIRPLQQPSAEEAEAFFQKYLAED